MDVKKEYFGLVECQAEGIDFSPFLRFKGTHGTHYFLPLRRGGFHDALEMMNAVVYGPSVQGRKAMSYCPYCGEKLAG